MPHSSTFRSSVAYFMAVFRADCTNSETKSAFVYSLIPMNRRNSMTKSKQFQLESLYSWKEDKEMKKRKKEVRHLQRKHSDASRELINGRIRYRKRLTVPANFSLLCCINDDSAGRMSVDNEAVTDDAVQTSEILNCALPTSRVKKVCRLDPDLAMITSDAVQFLTKATELFVAELAKASYTQAVLEKRKTIQVKDIDRAISSKALFEFLEDTLCDWPEAESSKIVSQVGSATLENDTEMELIPEENGEEVEEEEAVAEPDVEDDNVEGDQVDEEA